MPLWQVALIVLIGAWALQALGTYVQMRHYSAIMGNMSGAWADGYVGTGNARAKLGAGLILLVVVSPDRVVRRLMVMRGRSVFARFNRVASVEGQPLEALKANPLFQDKAHEGALSIAIKQIDKAASRAGTTAARAEAAPA